MRKDVEELSGIQKLIQVCKVAFRIPENTDYYSDEDFKAAERKFIKNACVRGIIPMGKTPPDDRRSAAGDGAL
jgi:hypothetical protein